MPKKEVPMYIKMTRFVGSKVVEQFNTVPIRILRDIQRLKGPGVDFRIRMNLRHLRRAVSELFDDGSYILYEVKFGKPGDDLQKQDHTPTESDS